MSNPFFDHPFLNSPYAYPARHWELDETGQPTQKVVDKGCRAEVALPDSIAKSKRIVVKETHHLVAEVMKVFRV